MHDIPGAKQALGMGAPPHLPPAQSLLIRSGLMRLLSARLFTLH